MKELVLIRGLPGSGKTTIAKTYAAKGYEHYEADSYFTDASGVYRFNAKELAFAHMYCQHRCYMAMRRGSNIVIANTFTRRWEMEPYINMASLKGYSVKILIARGEYESLHDVPKEQIEKMRERWED